MGPHDVNPLKASLHSDFEHALTTRRSEIFLGIDGSHRNGAGFCRPYQCRKRIVAIRDESDHSESNIFIILDLLTRLKM